MNLRLEGSDLLAPEPGDLRARGFWTRPGTESEPLMDCKESFRGRGLIIRSDGEPRKEAAVMSRLLWSRVTVAELGDIMEAELTGTCRAGCSGCDRGCWSAIVFHFITVYTTQRSKIERKSRGEACECYEGGIATSRQRELRN